MLMFSRTLLFRQILSRLKRFPVDKPRVIPQFVRAKTFSYGQLVQFESLVRKICPFYG